MEIEATNKRGHDILIVCHYSYFHISLLTPNEYSQFIEQTKIYHRIYIHTKHQ